MLVEWFSRLTDSDFRSGHHFGTFYVWWSEESVEKSSTSAGVSCMLTQIPIVSVRVKDYGVDLSIVEYSMFRYSVLHRTTLGMNKHEHISTVRPSSAQCSKHYKGASALQA